MALEKTDTGKQLFPATRLTGHLPRKMENQRAGLLPASYSAVAMTGKSSF
jgi:hypothetical protein